MSVDQECLESFLKTAQLLRVKGLTDDTNPNSSSSNMGPNDGGNNNNNFSSASVTSRNGCFDSILMREVLRMFSEPSVSFTFFKSADHVSKVTASIFNYAENLLC